MRKVERVQECEVGVVPRCERGRVAPGGGADDHDEAVGRVDAKGLLHDPASVSSPVFSQCKHPRLQPLRPPWAAAGRLEVTSRRCPEHPTLLRDSTAGAREQHHFQATSKGGCRNSRSFPTASSRR